jgi:hypothetical protein
MRLDGLGCDAVGFHDGEKPTFWECQPGGAEVQALLTGNVRLMGAFGLIW